MKRLLIIVLLALPALGQTAPAAHKAFTIGKETTVVDGPLKPDGTIDYISVINSLIGSDVKNADNAAIPLLTIQAGISIDGKILPRIRQMLETLHAPIPEKPERMASLDEFAARKKGVAATADPDEVMRNVELEDRLVFHVWKAQDQPLAADWIASLAGTLKLAEEASRRTKFYVPFSVPTEKSLIGLDDAAISAMPFISILGPSRLLLTRAQMRAGAGDIAGAVSDVRAARKIARLVEQERFALAHLMGLAVEYNAMRAVAGMAASGTLSREQLALLRQETLALPLIPDADPTREKVEEMMALDLDMQCIAGKSRDVMRLMAFDLSGTMEPDLSDWKNADFDIMLRETVKLFADDVPGDTYLEKSRNWDKKLAAEPEGPSLLATIATLGDGGKLDDMPKRVNAFLKQRADESREVYTRRITRWLMGANSSDIQRNLGLYERMRMARVLALTSVALAEYRLAHGAYPDTLEPLKPAPELDGYTGKALHYRRQEDRFTLWSGGLNATDDGAAKDDIVVGG